MLCTIHEKKKTRIQKFKETGDTRYFYRNKVGKACFQHDMAYENFNALPRRTVSDKILRDKGFKTTSDPKYDGCQCRLVAMVHRVFDKKAGQI